jgi:hypothetical protein
MIEQKAIEQEVIVVYSEKIRKGIEIKGNIDGRDYYIVGTKEEK